MTDDLEMRFWGDCSNTFGEELKQLVYLDRMGFQSISTWRSPVSFDAGGKSFIDIGGGPCSALLKFENAGRRIVVDPGDYPSWVAHRYAQCKIIFTRGRGEDLLDYFTQLSLPTFDVALIYNCLQHVDSPERIIRNAKTVARELKMFEWIDIPPHDGHPWMLTESLLNEWTGQKGTVEEMNEGGCVGRAWYL